MLRGSPGFDTPEHMAEREPMFAIRPLYLIFIDSLHRFGIPYQLAISLISSACYFAIGILLLAWTRKPFLSALTMCFPLMMLLGRQGVPDGLNALCILGALYALVHKRDGQAIAVLMSAVWIRTDSVLVCFALLLWLVYERRLGAFYCAVLMAVAAASVAAINYYSGNYGYVVTFRAAFVGARHPSMISHAALTAHEYIAAWVLNLPSIVPQTAPWVLMGALAWYLKFRNREWLLPVTAAAIVHFAMFPSGEVRYLNWACLFAGVIFVAGLPEVRARRSKAVSHRATIKNALVPLDSRSAVAG